MKKVSKKRFYDFIGNQDAYVRVENPYGFPFTTLFELHGNANKPLGKIVDSYTDGVEHKHPIVSTYYINE